MRLIHRVIIILSAAALAMLVGNALILHLLVGEEFRNLENELAVRNANRAVDAVSNNLAHLRSSAMDWATWDSSYAFMQGENAAGFHRAEPDVPELPGHSGQPDVFPALRRDGGLGRHP